MNEVWKKKVSCLLTKTMEHMVIMTVNGSFKVQIYEPDIPEDVLRYVQKRNAEKRAK